jgi:hypothetical protein
MHTTEASLKLKNPLNWFSMMMDIIPFIPATLLKKQNGNNHGRMLLLMQLGVGSKQCCEPYLGNEEKLRGV